MLKNITNKHISRSIIFIKVIVIIVLGYQIWKKFETDPDFHMSLDNEFFLFVLVGFVAEVIDGSIGMAYGATCSGILIFFGVPPALASAGVHTAEVFTTGVSGLSHLHFKNVDKRLFFKLVITGVIGSVIGAYLLSSVLPGEKIKPFIAAYLFFVGLRLLYFEIRRRKKEQKSLKYLPALGLVGGTFDAIGGGGWGPVVTSTILNSGNNARHTIGTVNTAEFFVTFASTSVFLFLVGIDSWKIILGLIVGGVIAAPLGAYVVKTFNHRLLMFIVGGVLVLISSLTLYSHFFR